MEPIRFKDIRNCRALIKFELLEDMDLDVLEKSSYKPKKCWEFNFSEEERRNKLRDINRNAPDTLKFR